MTASPRRIATTKAEKEYDLLVYGEAWERTPMAEETPEMTSDEVQAIRDWAEMNVDSTRGKRVILSLCEAVDGLIGRARRADELETGISRLRVVAEERNNSGFGAMSAFYVAEELTQLLGRGDT